MSSVPKTAGSERRGAQRRPILDSFSFFVVVPKKGDHRLKVNDVSETGLGFDYDIDGESPETFPVKAGEVMDVYLYLNQSLYLPLRVTVARVDDSKVIRRIGAEFVKGSSQALSLNALSAFVQMIDGISEAVRFDATT